MARTPTDKSKDTSGSGSDKSKTAREDEILMREIDEAVRQDDAKEFFQKYGAAIAVALVLLIGGMFAYSWWDSSNEAALEADSEAIVSALDSVDAGDFAGAEGKVGELLDSDNVGARTAARMLQAAAALEQDNPAKAIELYATIVADEEAPGPLRDLALIREISTDFDNREPADIIARLAPLAVPGNAFFGSAGELTAIAHLEAGNREEAGMMFSQIAKDEDQPDSLRERSRQMAGLLGVDTIDDVDQLLEDQGALAPQVPQAPQ